jgi:5-methylcytosine-specific restriction protein B
MDEREEEFIEKARLEIETKSYITSDDSFSEALSAIKNGKSIIIFGPPGTGKTRMAYRLKLALQDESKLGKFDTVQFHHKFTYEDFIEGYAPNASGGFDRKDGIFKSFIRVPSPADKLDIFVIDEINRADLTTTFGELLFLMDDRKDRSVKTSHFGETIQLPENTIIIGTMNTADRNIATLDFALRRRFTFIALYTDYDELLKIYSTRGVETVSSQDIVDAANRINSRIASNKLMGRHMELGNSMWVPNGVDAITIRDVADVFRQTIIPQLEAYCGYGYEDQLAAILNQHISQLYLNRKKISDEDIIGLINDLASAKQ